MSDKFVTLFLGPSNVGKHKVRHAMAAHADLGVIVSVNDIADGLSAPNNVARDRQASELAQKRVKKLIEQGDNVCVEIVPFELRALAFLHLAAERDYGVFINFVGADPSLLDEKPIRPRGDLIAKPGLRTLQLLQDMRDSCHQLALWDGFGPNPERAFVLRYFPGEGRVTRNSVYNYKVSDIQADIETPDYAGRGEKFLRKYCSLSDGELGDKGRTSVMPRWVIQFFWSPLLGLSHQELGLLGPPTCD